MTTSRLLITSLLLLLTGCGNFMNLKENLAAIDDSFTTVSITASAASCRDCPLFAVVMAGDEPGKILSFRLIEQEVGWRALLPKSAGSIFVFHDANKDFSFQPDEAHAEFLLPGTPPGQISLSVPAGAAPARNPPRGSLLGASGAISEGLNLHTGTLAGIDDPRFNADQARRGMWEPLEFVRTGHAGLYFLETYDAARTPVLFVHGISGHPREFEAMIARLDRTKYQPWVFYYPSGLEIPTVSSGLLSLLVKLQYQHHFNELHIVAHSMGGVAVRALLADCEKARGCPWLRRYVSLSSPFGGDWAAQSGVDHSPVVMPVWRSMAQEGPFMRGLFERPLPGQVAHHLGFGFLNKGLFSGKSGDGTIALESQLRPEAQQQASSLRGFNTTHAGILEDPAAIRWVMQALDQNER